MTYSNDLLDCLISSGSILFAGDAIIYGFNMSINHLFNAVRHKLQILLDLFDANKLSLNLTKHYYTLFSEIVWNHVTKYQIWT